MKSSVSSWRRTCSSSSAGGARATRAAVPSQSSSSAAAVASTSGEIESSFDYNSYRHASTCVLRGLPDLPVDDLDAPLVF